MADGGPRPLRLTPAPLRATLSLAALVLAGYFIALGVLAVTAEAAIAAVFFAAWVVGG